jgi:hypothetical protein
VLAAPVLVVGGLFLDHAAGYHGSCGPYAPDIPVHPCSFPVYLRNFFSPFAVMGLMMLSVVAVGGAGALVAVAWVVGVVVWMIRRPRR